MPEINGSKQLGDFEYQKFRADSLGKPAVATVGGGLIPMAFTRISFSNADVNGNYQTGTVLNGATQVGTLTFDYDGNNNLVDVQFTAV